MTDLKKRLLETREKREKEKATDEKITKALEASGGFVVRNRGDDLDMDPIEVSSVEELFTATPKARIYTYGAELAKRGIERESSRYRNAIPAAMTWLRLNRAFYGLIYDEMTVHVTQEVMTAEVGVGPRGIDLYMNPDFMALFNTRQAAFIIQHECGHVIAGHHQRRAKTLARLGVSATLLQLTNMALDLAVNSVIQDKRNTPDCALLPGMFEYLDSRGYKQKFPERLTYEQYLELMLREQKKDPDFIARVLGGLGLPRADGDKGESQGTIDDHGHWSDSKLDTEAMCEVVRQRVENAVKRAAARGLDPGDAKEWIDELLTKSATDFASRFHGAVGRSTANGQKVPTMFRMSRRYGMPPGRIRQNRVQVMYYQDTSGSMGMDEIKIGLSEAFNMAQSGQVEVRIQQFDVEFHGGLLDVSEMGRVKVRVGGRGGTCLKPVVEDVNRRRPDIVIVSTDGGLQHNLRPVCRVPWIWLLTSHGMSPGWGEIIRLPTLADILRGIKAKAESTDAQRQQTHWH